MASFDNDAFDTDAFDTDAFDLDAGGGGGGEDDPHHRIHRTPSVWGMGFMVLLLAGAFYLFS